MIVWAIGNYPISYKLKPNYPFNNYEGNICSGYGIHHSQTTGKEKAGFLALLIGALLYIFSIFYWRTKASQFLKQFSPKGTGAMMNGKFR